MPAVVAASGEQRALAELAAFHVEFAVRERSVLAVYLPERELPAEEAGVVRRAHDQLGSPLRVLAQRRG